MKLAARMASRRNLAEMCDSSGAGVVVSCQGRALTQPVAVEEFAKSLGETPLSLAPR